MSYEISGKVKVIEQKQTFASGFEKQEFVITTEEQYPQDIKFELVKDKISLLNDVNVGEMVSVSFNVRGNEYNGKYYVNLQAWRLQKGGGSTSKSAVESGASSMPNTPWPEASSAPIAADDEDDLPF